MDENNTPGMFHDRRKEKHCRVLVNSQPNQEKMDTTSIDELIFQKLLNEEFY